MPKQQKYFISGVEFDTRTYCADFNDVIKQQAQKIKALKQEITQLRQLQQQQLSKALEKKHQQALKEEAKEQPKEERKSIIMITDKPIN
jgi:Zn finger protein HypA/HybF involved in hydrogenase expression